MVESMANRYSARPVTIEADQDINWSSVSQEAVEWLRQYVRFPTVNDPGSLDALQAQESPWLAGYEAEAAEFLAEILRRERVPVDLIEFAPGRTNLIARLEGSGAARPITLLSHSDVVPTVRQEWEDGIDPFAATIRGGFLYGRGSLDLKGLGIAHLISLLLLRRLNVPLKRDVILLVVADEETGGEFGAKRLLHERPELLDTEVVLGEGAYSLRGLLPKVSTVHAVSVAEKGYLELELISEEKASHASMPESNSAPIQLIRALGRVLKMTNSIRITPPAEALIKHLSMTASGLHRVLLSHPRLATRLAPGHLTSSSIISAMLKDTIAVTILESGYKSNVIPGQARAVLSIRFLPGTDPDVLTERIRRSIANPKIEIRRLKFKPANVSEFDTPQFSIIEKHALALQKDAFVTPILSPGASDCRHWRKAGVTCYGWVPFVIPGSDLHSVHGPNERISIDAFGSGIRAMYNTVAEMATSV